MSANYQHKSLVIRQRGFTLIEAFITVTMLGILASIAVNVYYDYVVRIKVSESGAIIAPIQTAIGMEVSLNGVLPNSLSSIENVSSAPTAYAATYVSTVNVTTIGAIFVQLRSRADLRTASGDHILYTPIWSLGDSNVKWSVSGTVPDKYMPDGY